MLIKRKPQRGHIQPATLQRCHHHQQQQQHMQHATCSLWLLIINKIRCSEMCTSAEKHDAIEKPLGELFFQVTKALARHI